MIDINQPVEPGHDMVLNYENGGQGLGTGEEFDKQTKQGKLIGSSADVLADVPKRDAQGHFVKE